jgi:hypothetical protein
MLTAHRSPLTAHRAAVAAVVALFLPIRGAEACSDATEWFNGDITWIHAPQAIEVNSEYVVRVQVINVTTEGWPEPVQVLVCNPNLPVSPTPSLDTGSCESVGLVETDASWGALWDDVLTGYGTGAVSSSNPNRNQHFRGAFDADADVLRASLIQTAAPVCGTRMIAPTDYDPDRLLDNSGAGLTTFLNQLDITSTHNGAQWVDGDNSFVTQERPEHLYHASYDGSGWQADTPGFTLPLDGLDPEVELHRRLPTGALQDTSRLREIGPLIPSRIAYGRVGWDWLWHGTCDAGSSVGEWCLPTGHPRVGRDGIISASACTTDGGTCQMVCPDTGAANEASYDFEVLLDFIDEAWGDSSVLALPVNATGQDLHIAQRAALRIMPYFNDQISGDWMAPPAFLYDSITGCGATFATVTADGQSVPWVRAEDPQYMDQAERLIHALGGSSATHLDPAPSHSAFAGLADDTRVFSLDIGSVGVDGEWTTLDGGLLGTHSDVCFEDQGTPTLYNDDTYAIAENRWWSDIIDVYNAEFAAGTSSLHLVGKVEYSTNAAELDGVTGNDSLEWTCYALDEYVTGRRGTALWANPTTPAPTRHVEGSYTAQRNGVRYDSWGTRELEGAWWLLQAGEVGQYLKYSEAWEDASYQGEIWENMSELIALERDGPKPSACWADDPATYGYWDLDEAVRYSIARHFSVFNFKRNPIVPYLEFPGGPGIDLQRLDADWCDCSPTPDEPCAASAIQRLLSETGPRVRLVARAFRGEQPHSTTMTVRLWTRNEGNAPLLYPYKLQLAFIDRAVFDPLDPADREWKPTFPNPSVGRETGGLLPILIGRTEYDLTVVDVRTTAPAAERDPDVLADYGPTCDAARQLNEGSYAAARASTEHITEPCPEDTDTDVETDVPTAGPQTLDGAATYDNLAVPVPAYCPSISTLACATPPLAVTPRYEVGLVTPSTEGSYALVYRFFDDSTPTADKKVHLDIPHGQLGDDTTQRWGFLGLVEVTP